MGEKHAYLEICVVNFGCPSQWTPHSVVERERCWIVTAEDSGFGLSLSIR